MTKCAFFFSEVVGKHSPVHWFMRKAMAEEGIEFICVARYKFDMFNTKEYSDMKGYYLYDHFSELNNEEIIELEKKIAFPFSTVRVMNKVATIRYPNIKNLPDDKYLANCVKSWIEFFENEKPDFYLHTLIDEYPGVVGLEVAKALGVPTIVLHPGKISSSFVLLDGDFNIVFYKALSEQEILEGYEKAIKIMFSERILNEKVGDSFKKDWALLSPTAIIRLVKSFFKNFNVYYMMLPKEDRKLWYSTFELMVRQIKYFFRSSVAPSFFSYEPRKGEKFVLFPLHYTDDATITARTPILDQIKLVEDVSKALPCDTVLYVKAHPHWKCSDLKLSSMQRLKKLPNVKLLKINSNTKELIKNSEYVVIINSATGFEALAIGKKVVSFGKDYPAEIIPRVRTFEDFYDINAIKFDYEKAKRFVGLYYNNAIFQHSPHYFGVSPYSDEEGDFNEIRKIVCEIKKAYSFIKAENKKDERESKLRNILRYKF